MSIQVNGLVLDSNGNEFSGSLTALASYLTNDLVNYTATTNSPVQSSKTGVVYVTLTDLERNQYYACKFTSSNAADCIVRYRNNVDLYARSVGEDTARDQRTGVRYPKSRMVVDGIGRKVADKHYIKPILENPALNLPQGDSN